MDSADRPTLSRNIGRFFGHIVRAVKADPERGDRVTVSRRVQEQRCGEVVLRRTTIDEIELPAGARLDANASPPTPGSTPCPSPKRSS